MRTLVVLLGPTGVGKTELSLKVAEYFNSPIISIDSRQLYREIEVGTAAPTLEQKSRVEHHFVGTLGIEDYYSVSDYELNAIELLGKLHTKHSVVIATGGSMLYIDALCNGIDPMPTIDDDLRLQLQDQFKVGGLDPLISQLKILDPVYYNEVDLKNHKRIIHALEVCLTTGKPFSSFRSKSKKERPFQIIKVGIMRERQELYDRINSRVDIMLKDGILEEANKFYTKKNCNALNTVGYKELFKYLDGEWSLNFAVDKIKQSTRIYSRQQMRWFQKDEDVNWINLSEVTDEDALQTIIKLVNV